MRKRTHRLVLGWLGLLWAGLAMAEETLPEPVGWELMRDLRTDAAPGALAPEALADVLGLLYQGAAGKTAAQMQTLLFGGAEPEEVEAKRVARQATLNGYRVLHALWCDAETTLMPAFEARGRQNWGVQFGVWPANASGEVRAGEINRWFGERTRGAVTQVIEAEDTGRAPLVGVVLAAFAAPWADDIFADGRTSPELFYASVEERFAVAMMRAKAVLAYAEDDDFQFVRIAYGGSSLGLHLLLPKRAQAAAAAFAKADGERWRTLATAAKPRTVALSLPKVDVSERTDWRARLLPEFGLDRPFAPGAADFSKLATHPTGPFALGPLLQRAWVRWDERGTEARAVTSYPAAFGDAPESASAAAFVANHPFAYVIGDLAAGRVLFAGRIARSGQMPSLPDGPK